MGHSLQNHQEKPRKDKSRLKRGRKELRDVRKRRYEQTNDEEELEDQQKQDSEEEEDELVEEPAEIGAYNALVTLLKSDHPEPVKKKIKKKVAEEAKQPEVDEELPEEVGDDEDEEELDQQEAEQDNEDVHNKFDAFNRHFNDEDLIEELVDKHQKEKSRTKLANKKQFGNVTQLNYSFREASEQSPKGFAKKLKYHNVKQKIQTELLNKEPNEVGQALIDSLLTYQNVNCQLHGMVDDIKSKYQDYYLLHCLNHIYKTRDRVLNNNEKRVQAQKQIEEGVMNPEDEPEFRDQGYTRPKVLILLPTRNFAWEVVNKLIDLSSPDSVEYKSRFKDQYYDDFDVNDLNPKKPAEFKEFFKGNSNDYFCMGIKFTRKTMKLFSKYDQSDVIIASPLGLKMTLEKTEASFLSSIEITILDKAEGLLMQNWDHVSEILSQHLNAPPKNFDNLKVDFSRIRMWAINDHYKYVAQMIGFSKYNFPELNNVTLSNPKISANLQSGTAVFKSVCNDADSELTHLKHQLTRTGILNNNTRLKQIFMRFDADSLVTEPEKRFTFFKNVLLPQIQHKLSYDEGTLIYFPSYIDYLRVKNYLENDTSVSAVAIDEYSSQASLTRSRAMFAKGHSSAKILLYTERLHFYKRYDIRGVRNVMFYGIPSDPSFYSEVLKFIVDNKIRADMANRKSDESSDLIDLNLCMVRVLFSKLDMMKLEKIVGLKNAKALSLGDSEMNEFH
ncbi:hypothetical protein OGAPHI_004277 [Ogataea philodendri]|uniref:U3 small nucleolar RNA-associated protein 25 n=1 Tax=Ogataea philodendri TaxID=1378263 RepID=A0A9P8P5W6_9ASCO|nr:uncharacterized protein OGAPHI_004277 [Ogataea philodendri]KAH3666088.1 hypothetical protein OGAPHI_004277 [Ogataea philodendri]